MIFAYNYPPAAVASDNQSYTQTTEFTVRDCSADSYTNDCPPGWNDTLCSNDDAYCQPFERGDRLCHQFHFNLRPGQYLQLFYVDCQATESPENEMPAEWFTYQAGMNDEKTPIQNICINTGEMPTSLRCFYLLIKLFSDGIGDPVLQGTRCTEPYCEVQCNEETMLISGTYPDRDCFGNVYGPVSGNANIFSNAVRVQGSIEQNGYTFEEIIVGERRTGKNLKRKFDLRTHKIPPYMADRVATAIGAQVVTIDGEVYVGITALDKNFEEGRMWIIRTTAFQECENNFTCE